MALALMWLFLCLLAKDAEAYNRRVDLQNKLRLATEQKNEAFALRRSAFESLRQYKLNNPPRNRFVAPEKMGEKYMSALSSLIEFYAIEYRASHPRDLTPCKYCRRYDSKVERIKSDGLDGHYHSFCASEIVRHAREELARRMA